METRTKQDTTDKAPTKSTPPSRRVELGLARAWGVDEVSEHEYVFAYLLQCLGGAARGARDVGATARGRSRRVAGVRARRRGHQVLAGGADHAVEREAARAGMDVPHGRLLVRRRHDAR